jgi:hypothetical protein
MTAVRVMYADDESGWNALAIITVPNDSEYGDEKPCNISNRQAGDKLPPSNVQRYIRTYHNEYVTRNEHACRTDGQPAVPLAYISKRNLQHASRAAGTILTLSIY